LVEVVWCGLEDNRLVDSVERWRRVRSFSEGAVVASRLHRIGVSSRSNQDVSTNRRVAKVFERLTAIVLNA